MANYTTQQQIEAILQRSLTTAEVAYLTILLPAIDSYINEQTGTTFLPTSPDNDVEVYEQGQDDYNNNHSWPNRYYDRNERSGGSTLIIPTMRTVTAVATSTGFPDNFVTVPTSEWVRYPRSGPILALKRNGSWGGPETTVRITGKLGYDSVPTIIGAIAAAMGANAITASSNSAASSGGAYKSEKVGDWQVTYADGASSSSSSSSGVPTISASALETLNGYKRLSRSI